jgi:SAM-dependent methyltransferase
LAGLGAVSGIHHIEAKRRAFGYAGEFVSYKGIINLGSGPQLFTPLAEDIANALEVVANIDIVPDGLPNFIELDIGTDRLPFSDKMFDCAFMSHILEHLEDWEYALTEAIRVADHVVVVLPHPLSIASWFNRLHKQHFSLQDIRDIEEAYPSVTVFY